MKYFVYLIALMCILLFSCKKSDSITSNNSCELAGRFFNTTVLKQCPGKMPAEIPYYALELSFPSSDTIVISNGIEKFKLPFTKTDKNCQFKIANAAQLGDMYFDVLRDSVIQLYDTAWTKGSTFSSFAKWRNPERNNWNFENFLNECAIAGTYMIKEKDGTSRPVYFLPNGQMSGIKPYLGYSLCYAGDCLEETAEPANLVEFMNDKGQNELFAYRWTEDQSTLQLLKVGDPKPGIKGQRTIGDVAFELKKGLSNE